MSNHADDPVGTNLGIEDLDNALFAEVVERLAQLLGLGRIAQHDAAQNFRREIGQASKADFVAFRQRVTDPKRAMIGYADDIARLRAVGNLAVLREKQDRRVDRDRLAKA